MKGRNITFDNYYTSLGLARELLIRKITEIGTMRHNRLGIPKEIKSLEGRKPYSTVVWWEQKQGKYTFTSYVVPTKSSGLKNVIFLSTMPQLLGTQKKEDNEFAKPDVGKMYDNTKRKIKFVLWVK